jgi:hypothetical protein
MVERSAKINVAIAAPTSTTPYLETGLGVLLNGGTTDRRVEMEFFILDTATGRLIPKLNFCRLSRAQALRAYRESLGSALTNAQDALRNAQQPVANAVAAMNTAVNSVNTLLGQNPDATTPRNTDELMTAIGGLSQTTDRETLERRVAEILDLNVVGGVLFPKGTTNLGPIRSMFRSLELSGSNCTIPAFSDFGSFLMITALQETIETRVPGACGTDDVEFEVVERKIGENISIAKAAKLAGVAESEVLVRFFWFNSIRLDGATLTRLKALGLTGSALSAVVSGSASGSVSSTVVDVSTVDNLRASGLLDFEICTLLTRPDNRGGVNTSPTTDDVVRAITRAFNGATGANRNRAGQGTDAITAPADGGPAPAGRAGDPALLLGSVLNLSRSLRLRIRRGTRRLRRLETPIGGQTDTIETFEDQEIVDPVTGLPLAGPASITVDGTPINVTGLSQECTDITQYLFDSIAAIQQLAEEASDFIRNLFGQLGLGLHTLQAGLEFTSCLGSINLGLDLSLDIAIAIPFQIQVFLGLFAGALSLVVSAILAIKALLCIPQGIINLLFGGICGFKPFDFNLCPPDIAAALDRVLTLVNLVTSLVTQISSALQVMKIDVQGALRASLDLKVFSACALAAFPVGVALGLAGDLDIQTSAAATVSEA